MAATAVAVLANAGIAYAFGGAGQAAVAGGLALGSSLLHRWTDGPADDPSKALTPRVFKGSLFEAQWIAGSPKFNGGQVRYSEERYLKNSLASQDPDMGWGVNIPGNTKFPLPWITARQIIVFSEEAISAPETIWVNGKKMPFTGANGIYISNVNAWAQEIADLRARLSRLDGQRALQPNHPNYSLALDLQNKISTLENLLTDSIWAHDPITGLSLPTVRITFDFGGTDVSAADTKCLEIKNRIEKKARNFPAQEQFQKELEDFGTFWDGTSNILQGLSWALVETRAWQPKEGNSGQWDSNFPKVDLVAEGMTSNPAEIAHWYLTTLCGVDSDDIIGYDTARGICDELVTILPVVDGDQDEDKDFTSYDVYKILYPQAVDSNGDIDPNLLPAANVRNAGLIEWNTLYAGATNAEKRYQCHGKITSSMMLKPDQLLQSLGDAMGGWIINIGGKYKFIAGKASDPVLEITSADITGQHINWTIGPSLRENINAIRAEISQSVTKDYAKQSLGTVEDSALIAADGYKEWNAGILPFTINEILGRRKMNVLLRRLAPGLLVGNFTIGPGERWKHWALQAGDRITINHPIDGVVSKKFLIESIQPMFDSQLALTVKEDPDEIYSDSFDLLGEGLIAARNINNKPWTPTETPTAFPKIVFVNVEKSVVGSLIRVAISQIGILGTAAENDRLFWRVGNDDWNEFVDTVGSVSGTGEVTPSISVGGIDNDIEGTWDMVWSGLQTGRALLPKSVLIAIRRPDEDNNFTVIDSKEIDILTVSPTITYTEEIPPDPAGYPESTWAIRVEEPE